MALLSPPQYNEKLNTFRLAHPELTKMQFEILVTYLKACNHFEKIITSKKMYDFRRLSFSKLTRHFETAETHRLLALEFFGEEVRFERPRLDPRVKKWETEEEIVEAFAEWIIRKSEEVGKPVFPSSTNLYLQEDLPDYGKVREIIGCGIVELYKRLYDDKLIPFKYEYVAKAIKITPPQQAYFITGNESYRRQKEMTKFNPRRGSNY